MKGNKNVWADHYTRQAQKEHFPARSVYKLKEIQQKYRLIKSGDRVLDLGCSPGSWLLYAAQIVGAEGQVTGIDIEPVNVKLPPHAAVYRGDIFSLDDQLLEAIGEGYDGVLSDMAPSTTGNRIVDAAKSFELSSAALSLAGKRLVPGGFFLCKIFQGPDFETFRNLLKERFKQHKIFKP
ncbi:MAG: RlmE family RNA methyltransferase, partial [Desulfobacteraceae bacterium]